MTQSSAFKAEEGHFVADRLHPFIERVRHLLEGDAAKNWTAEDIARTKVILANAVTTVGEQAGDNDALSEAIDLYNGGFTGFTRQQYPVDWATTQNNLGNALRNLGTRTHDTNQLCEALADHISAWQVFSEGAPHYASMAVAGAKTDVAATHNQSRGTASVCLQTYSTDLTQMGVPN